MYATSLFFIVTASLLADRKHRNLQIGCDLRLRPTVLGKPRGDLYSSVFPRISQVDSDGALCAGLPPARVQFCRLPHYIGDSLFLKENSTPRLHKEILNVAETSGVSVGGSPRRGPGGRGAAIPQIIPGSALGDHRVVAPSVRIVMGAWHPGRACTT